MRKLIFLLVGIFLISNVSAISWSGGTITIINQTTVINITNNITNNVGMNFTNLALTNESNIWDDGLNNSLGEGGFWKGLFNWTTLTNWLSFDGATLSFNETRLNNTIGQYTSNITSGDVNVWNISGNNIFPKDLDFNVGIGTSNPALTLDVAGSGIIRGNLNVTNNLSIGETNQVNIFEEGGDLIFK